MEKLNRLHDVSKYLYLENKTITHKVSKRTIKIITVNKFSDSFGNETFLCSYYWNNYGQIGTDLIDNIVQNYQIDE